MVAIAAVASMHSTTHVSAGIGCGACCLACDGGGTCRGDCCGVAALMLPPAMSLGSTAAPQFKTWASQLPSGGVSEHEGYSISSVSDMAFCSSCCGLMTEADALLHARTLRAPCLPKCFGLRHEVSELSVRLISMNADIKRVVQRLPSELQAVLNEQ